MFLDYHVFSIIIFKFNCQTINEYFDILILLFYLLNCIQITLKSLNIRLTIKFICHRSRRYFNFNDL